MTFVGNVKNEDVKHYVHAADLFLFASKSETQGIVLAEAYGSRNSGSCGSRGRIGRYCQRRSKRIFDRRRGKQVGGESHRSSTAGEPV